MHKKKKKKSETYKTCIEERVKHIKLVCLSLLPHADIWGKFKSCGMDAKITSKFIYLLGPITIIRTLKRKKKYKLLYCNRWILACFLSRYILCNFISIIWVILYFFASSFTWVTSFSFSDLTFQTKVLVFTRINNLTIFL